MKYVYSQGVVNDSKYLLKTALIFATAIILLLGAVSYVSAKPNKESNRVPGHTFSRYDSDDNGFSDEGVYVNGHYTALYAYDANGDWYWDLGDDRVQGSVSSVDELDQATLTSCDYVNNYRADFGNDPYMDAGWIQNHINCSGYDDNGSYNYLIVHESDPRYTGNPDWAVWGDWEYHVLTATGSGNLVKAQPQTNI